MLTDIFPDKSFVYFYSARFGCIASRHGAPWRLLRLGHPTTATERLEERRMISRIRRTGKAYYQLDTTFSPNATLSDLNQLCIGSNYERQERNSDQILHVENYLYPLRVGNIIKPLWHASIASF